MSSLDVGRSTLTGWFSRAEKEQLEDRKPVPKHQPQKTPVEVVTEVMGMCLKYPERGGLSLSTFLALNGFNYLSPATINRIKKVIREQCGTSEAPLHQRYEFIQPHDAWAIDFLEFKWQEQTIYVLVVLDDHSRYILNWNATTSATFEFAKATLQETMLRYGVAPRLIKADNGPQFRSQLRAWLAGNGITLWSSPRYTPNYNGKVERVNADLRQAINNSLSQRTTLEKVLGSVAQCIYEHNHVWPHQSLYGVTPYHRLANLEGVVRTQVEHIKQKAQERLGQPNPKAQLILPGQPEQPQYCPELIIPGQSQSERKVEGLILPFSERKCKKQAFVRLSIAV